jgi:hypothetical protein
MVASLVFVALSLYLFIYEVLFGGYDRYMLVVGAAGVSFAWLAKWAELRHKNDLARRLADLTEQAVDVMRWAAVGATDPDEAAALVREASDRITAFKAENGLDR